MKTKNEIPSSVFPYSLLESCERFSDSLSKMEQEIYDLVAKSSPMPQRRFWETVAYLAQVASSQSRSVGEEFVRRVWVRQTNIMLEEVPSFVFSYSYEVKKIRESLNNVDTGRGDDSHGDLVDALPLLGPTASAYIQRLKTNADFKSFEQEWKNKVSTALADRVFCGENYIKMGLVDGLKRMLPSYFRENKEEYPPQVSF